MLFDALKREELKAVIEGRANTSRIPAVMNMHVDAHSFGDVKSEVVSILAQYPSDANVINYKMPHPFEGSAEYPSYRWVFNSQGKTSDSAKGIDEQIQIQDWDTIDEIIANFPDPNSKCMFPYDLPEDGTYRLGHWWFCMFERHWQLRGMTNALMDYYTDPESVHKLFRAITDFYLIAMERGKNEMNFDGIFVTDDMGTQTGPFFSPEIFRNFIKPYYKELIEKAHSLGMHFWLHSCGNIEKYLDDFIEIGLDVVHPIQKYAMNGEEIAAKYGGRICIWAGFDVQQTIPYGTEEDVRKEVNYMKKTYQRPEGRFIFGIGNVIKQDCPITSLKALFDEVFRISQ